MKRLRPTFVLLAVLGLTLLGLAGCGDQVVNANPPGNKPVRPSGAELGNVTTPDGRPLNLPQGVTGGTGGTTGGATAGATAGATSGATGG